MIKRLLSGVLLFSTITITAQRNSASPYSYFGIGESFEAVTVEQASMGGIGVALKNTRRLNFTNPASNADIRTATYGIGGSLSFLTIKEGSQSQTGNSTNLRYIALGFPVGKKAGLSLGLQPFSSVGYSLLDNQDPNNVTLFRGEGGASKIYASFGMYAFEGLSLGIEAGFIFGNLTNSVLNQRTNVAFSTKQEEKTSLRGGQFKFGAQYKRELKNGLNLYSGASVTVESDLSANGSERMYSLVFSNAGQEIPKDELYNRTVNGDLNVPLKSVFGFGLGKENKWYVGVNQQFQSALSTSSAIIANGGAYKYESSNKFSLGGFYIPKINSISSYWDRVVYRAGLRIENTGLQVKTNNQFTSINDFGINVGLGLPLPRQVSNLNIGFEYGQKGTTSNNLIKENYFNIRLSLSLNDINWFKKRQID
ncbi:MULTISPECIES: hypothetical protein [unclassified Tenacibaculum]|uniref:hypothetical protein n=1 Tax=unclassified Tenacibaculum TaxID=2635139 RepID=UPI001F39E2D9|nr:MULTISPECIES: hypothetical protein [unclassified Tenacibaculum]MCF2873525.1 hypothetical protein [Tenacibaculum sp. Cn5-1]MCF2933681.1 hypothetical protein [Tenacibaculum sp. Cn5-34]MCG7509737.1 hypothetical protein [Tenacibaculum sp. Cn5-46]